MIELGKIAYEAYCVSSGGVSLISGAQLPTWEKLSDPIKQAWTAAANAVCEEVHGQCDLPGGEE